jgi:hypothetical protein
MQWIFPNGEAREVERRVAAKLRPGDKFFKFLFEVREELFDDGFQATLLEAYEPRGQEPCPPALLAMANLLQRYCGLADHAAVSAAENDRRWQLVLGTLGSDVAPFGQGTLVRFRAKMVAHDLDRKLLDRTVELAKRTKKFGWKHLKVMLDSAPLEGAGRVEDTWNLIGRVMLKLVGSVAKAAGIDERVVIEGAGLTLLDAPSIKAALDIDWSDPDERHDALQRLIGEADLLDAWVRTELKKEAEEPPVCDLLELLRKVVEQDIEPDPDGNGDRIRQGVAEDRIISAGDTEMRHGRKSKSKTINGYKRHVALANGFIVGTAVEPANRPEHTPTTRLLDAARQHGNLQEAFFDRGYLAANDDIVDLREAGVKIHSRAWRGSTPEIFGKEHFQICLDAGVVACPAGKIAHIPPGGTVLFREEDCRGCPLKPYCTKGKRRGVHIHENEALLIELREEQRTKEGRAAYRERVAVEHRIARIDDVQGKRARYQGVRKNELDLNRSAAVVNLQEIGRLRRAA